MVSEDQLPDPNGLCFSPDYKKLYIVSTGKGPGDTGPGGKGDVWVFDVSSDNKVSNGKRFSDFMIDGIKCGPDGIRTDVYGNLWCSSNAGRNLGYSGVTVLVARGQAAGPHPHPGGVRQHHLRRPQAEPAVHGGQPVALCRLHRDPGFGAGVAIFCRVRAIPWRGVSWSSADGGDRSDESEARDPRGPAYDAGTSVARPRERWLP